MFSVDDASAEAIRRAYFEQGELAGVVEFRRCFPGLKPDNEQDRLHVRAIASWRPWPDPGDDHRGSGRR